MSTPTGLGAEPITSPWVLVDDLTAGQAADFLEAFVHWLDGPDQDAATACARALNHGQDTDPETTAEHADTIAARLRHCTNNTQLHTRGWTIRTN